MDNTESYYVNLYTESVVVDDHNNNGNKIILRAHKYDHAIVYRMSHDILCHNNARAEAYLQHGKSLTNSVGICVLYSTSAIYTRFYLIDFLKLKSGFVWSSCHNNSHTYNNNNDSCRRLLTYMAPRIASWPQTRHAHASHRS